MIQNKNDMVVKRIFNIVSDIEDNSAFLFGARQTGKSTFLEHTLPDAYFIDLLDSQLRLRLQKNPSLLYEMLQDKPSGTIVVIDEIPEIPELLNEVHRLIQKK